MGEFGRELQAWLEQVEHELMPRDPAEALALAEAFIQCDEVFFNRADDSSGVIGDAIRAACVLWLKAASRCESPASAWPDRITTLVAADEYGAREELLRRCDLLLSEAAMRGLVSSFETQFDDAMEHPCAASARVNWPASRASAALSLLSEALRDPDVLVRAVLRRSPSPNPMQKSTLAEAFLKYGRPEGALAWLEGSWEHLESARRHLHAQALAALGRTGEAAVDRQQIFEESLAVWDLHAWLDLLPPHEQASAIERARELAAAHDDPVVVALLLMDIGDDAAAEEALTGNPAAIEGRDYATLVPLAEALERKGLWTGATLVYRALLVAILERAYAPAYRHAARYWARLAALAPNLHRAEAARVARRVRGQDSRPAQAQVELLGTCQRREAGGRRRFRRRGRVGRRPARLTSLGLNLDQDWAPPKPPLAGTGCRPLPDIDHRPLWGNLDPIAVMLEQPLIANIFLNPFLTVSTSIRGADGHAASPGRRRDRGRR